MKRVVANVDVGADDAFALLLLLHADKIGAIKLEAILCSSGNTSLDYVTKNVVRLLETAKRTDVPVYRGSQEQILLPDHELLHYHGKDGFGDLEYTEEPDVSIVKPEHAAVALANIVNKNPNEISIVAVAPLTDIALTFKMFPNFAENVKELFIMGGNHQGVGNVTESIAEFNFYYDAEAAYITLESAKCPVSILTWETCLIPQTTFDWRYNTLGVIKNPVIELLNRAEKSIYPSTEKIWMACDAFLVASFLYPEIISKQNAFYVTVELNGKYTRGQMVLDHLKTKEPNVVIIEEIKQDVYENILLKAAEETM